MKQKYIQILKAGLIAGTMDILAACILVYIRTGHTYATGILKFIASGVFGKAALDGGSPMIFAGLLFHYLIAGIFAAFFFWVYPKIQIASKNRLATAVVYGIFAWCVMNLVVVPLSHVASRPIKLSNALINIGILIICIGIPVSFIAHSYYRKAAPKIQ
jgi:hypothetical protein